MERYVIIVLASLLASAVALPPSASKQYRKDYVYNGKTDAFYKLHIESKKAWQVREVCAAEGAVPMVPSSQQDIIQLHAMFKRFPDLGQYVWVGDDGQKHESAEEQPIIELDPPSDEVTTDGICDVVTRDGLIETYPCYNQLPFICKVEAKDAPYDSQCDVYAKGYRYASNVGSCYKIPPIIYSWDEGYAECQAEGGHLVVINSAAEHEFVWDLVKTTPAVEGAHTSWFFFAGFRAERPVEGKPRIFKTIFNQTLDEAGFNQWSENEPNNYLDTEYCGSIFKNDGKFNDLNCEHLYAFICEKEIHT